MMGFVLLLLAEKKLYLADFEHFSQNQTQLIIEIKLQLAPVKLMNISRGYYCLKKMKRNHLRLDINVTHLLSCDRLLLQQYVSRIPDDDTQLLPT